MNSKILQGVLTREEIESDPLYGDLRVTWAGHTGRCTFFAVKVVELLCQEYPDVFDFVIYNLKGHRVTRCHKTGILVDSSSRHDYGFS